jgi:hypothetical protein
MVRNPLILVCVAIVIPATAFGQARTAQNTQPGPARAGSAATDRTSGGSATVRPVSRTQEPSAEGSARVGDGGAARVGVGEGAAIELKNQHLIQEVPAMSPELQRELDRLLQVWSEASAKIERLQGKHVRIVYDSVFQTERQAEGEFAYQKSDKGRINLIPIAVTPELVAAREKEVKDARAQKRPPQVRTKVRTSEPYETNEPYELIADRPEQWSCDGERIFSLDMEKSEATVAQLPVDMRGGNIMDSPLPFLFGMPPVEAKRRFSMGFRSGKFDPSTGKAYLTIYPRLPQDAANWSKAELILDLKTFLPSAVQLVDPAGTKITVYKFRDCVKNQSTFVGILTGSNPRFTPDLKNFNVHTVGAENDVTPAPQGDPAMQQQEALVGKISGDPGLVNVTGVFHKDAVLQLQRQGLKRDTADKANNQILLETGPVATRKEDVYTVKAQEPPAGSPLKPGMRVKLTIWMDPAAAKKQ